VQYGALDILRREYGSLLSNEVEPDYNVSLDIDLEQVPTDPGMSVLLSFSATPLRKTFPIVRDSRCLYYLLSIIETQCPCSSI
jgi:Arp2/3 complex, 34 kD subunit p34-Arc